MRVHTGRKMWSYSICHSEVMPVFFCCFSCRGLLSSCPRHVLTLDSGKDDKESGGKPKVYQVRQETPHYFDFGGCDAVEIPGGGVVVNTGAGSVSSLSLFVICGEEGAGIGKKPHIYKNER